MSEVIGRLLLAPLIVAGLAGTTRADKTTEQRAQALFEAGRALVDAGKIDQGCDMLVESQQLDPQVGTKLNIARCRELQARLVDAYELYVEARTEAQAKADAIKTNFATKQIELLEAKLVRITLVAADTDVTVRLGIGDKLDERRRTGWEQIVVAPGTLTLEATASGRKPYRHQQVVEAGKRVTIAIPALAADDPRRTFGTPGIVMVAGGGLALASMALGLHAKSRYDSAVDAMDQGGIDSAQREADIATGVLVAGAITVTVGAILHFKWKKQRVTVAPTVDGSAGISFAGRF